MSGYPEPIPCSSTSVKNEPFSYGDADGATGGCDDNFLKYQPPGSAHTQMNSPPQQQSVMHRKKQEKLPLAQREKQNAIRRGLLRLQKECKDLEEIRVYLTGAVDDLEDELEFVMGMASLASEANDIVSSLDIPMIDSSMMTDDPFGNLLEIDYGGESQPEEPSSMDLSGESSTPRMPDETLVREILDD